MNMTDHFDEVVLSKTSDSIEHFCCYLDPKCSHRDKFAERVILLHPAVSLSPGDVFGWSESALELTVSEYQESFADSDELAASYQVCLKKLITSFCK